MTTKKQICANCGLEQEVSTTADLMFQICQGCSSMGEWGQPEAVEAEVVEVIEPMLPAEADTLTAVELFAPEKIKEVIDFVTLKAKAHKPDISTDKGRKAIASNAAEVSRSKTFLEKIGKAKSAAIKADAKTLDAGRRYMKDTLDLLRDEMREPLTKWEKAEKEKEAAERLAEQVASDHDAALVDDDIFNRQKAIAEKEAKLAKDEEDRVARAAEEKRLKEEKAREEELKAKAKKEAGEKAAKKEKDRLAKNEEERLADEERAADKKHRAAIKDKACKALALHDGITIGKAEYVFDIISNGDVPHITVNY